MNTFYIIIQQVIWFMICGLVILNVIGYTFLGLEAFYDNEAQCHGFKTGMGFMISLCLLILVTTLGYNEKQFFLIFWFFLLLVISLLTILLVFEMRRYGQRRQEKIGSETIRTGMNSLPEGLLLAKANGDIIVTNIVMHNMMREMTGKVIIRINDFWDYVVLSGQQQGDHYIVHDALGSTWFLKKEDIKIDGEAYIQVMAVDITKRYAIIDELDKKHAHLEEVKWRMRKVSKVSGDMFVAREETKARVALHNQLGQVLLMGKYCIEHPESTDFQNVHTLTQQMNRFLLEEGRGVLEMEQDDIRHIKDMARSIGITIHIHHEELIPLINHTVFVHALQEAATNAMKHGGAKHLYVNIIRDGTTIELTLTDDGKAQKDTFLESGGLKSLRKIVEQYGGKMMTYYQTGFVLKLVLQENGTNG